MYAFATHYLNIEKLSIIIMGHRVSQKRKIRTRTCILHEINT